MEGEHHDILSTVDSSQGIVAEHLANTRSRNPINGKTLFNSTVAAELMSGNRRKVKDLAYRGKRLRALFPAPDVCG